MATYKKAVKKVAAKKKAVKKVAAKKTKKIGGVAFMEVTCSTDKALAAKRAESIRKKGFKARVLDNGSHFCVYSSTKNQRTTKK